ncbi:hypothetical protein [Legionella bononiensis]|uniref:Uncharacterized protein n=1 Tax=Legionella bononiensis TaxID=2793102 RepID=A0ABS1WFJ7_9GAMM|nr:hypothetical protein [Legionella bononiensis]MBL7481587.1 hypothetical protein [Legionella bononiensis]MBL7528134.1 hypothetical protein [Legionella bononiensis]MBL7562610.1 hypothetical protein [Legionella bononiensis]
MSDKIQHTAAGLHEKMIHRYNDGLDHKHNKSHLLYRRHCKSHPSVPKNGLDEESETNGSTGLIREFKLRKMRKRLDKGRIH